MISDNKIDTHLSDILVIYTMRKYDDDESVRLRSWSGTTLGRETLVAEERLSLIGSSTTKNRLSNMGPTMHESEVYNNIKMPYEAQKRRIPMSIKIYTQNEKFYMEDLSNNTTIELTERVDDGKTLKLPENSSNRKFCSVEKALKGITLEYKETKTFEPGTNKTDKPKTSTKSNWESFIDDDDKELIKTLKLRATIKMEIKSLEEMIAEHMTRIEELKEQLEKTYTEEA